MRDNRQSAEQYRDWLINCLHRYGHDELIAVISPYGEDEMVKEMLAILKEQMAIRPVRPVAFGTTEENGVIRTLFKCPECYVMTERHQRFCWNCGRGLNWDG